MSAEGPHKLSLGWRVLHWAIILNLLAEFIQRVRAGRRPLAY